MGFNIIKPLATPLLDIWHNIPFLSVTASRSIWTPHRSGMLGLITWKQQQLQAAIIILWKRPKWRTSWVKTTLFNQSLHFWVLSIREHNVSNAFGSCLSLDVSLSTAKPLAGQCKCTHLDTFNSFRSQGTVFRFSLKRTKISAIRINVILF